MQLKRKLLVTLATVTLLSVPFAFIACSENNAPEKNVEFGEWVTVTAPTCENVGMEVRTSLTDPLITETRAIPSIGHDWNSWETVSEPTCLLAGVKKRTCNTCDNLDIGEIPMLGHSWGKWETVLDADCENCGTEVRVCLRDSKHTEYQEVAAIGHDYGDWVLTLAPTCTVGGVETRYCRNNNSHTELRSVKPYGHDWGTAVTTKRATCTEPGEQKIVCVNDSSHVYTTTVDALGHDYGDWVMSVPATESEKGEYIRVCRHDSAHTETRVSNALGSVDGLVYFLIEEGTEYAVAKDPNNPPSGTVIIPTEHNGLPVTRLCSNAFTGCDIERVVFLGNNLKTVMSAAFVGCEKLQSIEFPEGVTRVVGQAIVNCQNLKTVSFPSTVVEMGKVHDHYHGVIINCPALETITVAEGNEAYHVDNGCLMETETGTLLAATRNAEIPEYTTWIAKYGLLKSANEYVCISSSISYIDFKAFAGWTAEQTIIVKGFASEKEACAVWGRGWLNENNAVIIYEV